MQHVRWPPEPEGWRSVVRALEEGAVMVFPTDTLYGLGCLASHVGAVARVLALKSRGATRGCPLLAPDTASVRRLADPWPELAERLAGRFWPGPLTMVVRLRDGHGLVEGAAVEGSGAIRVPDRADVRDLGARCGNLLVATSANPAGLAPPATLAEVDPSILADVDLALDGGRCPGGVPSTIVDVSSGAPRLLRAGALRLDLLRGVPGLEGLGQEPP